MSKPPDRARVRRAFAKTLREMRRRVGLSQEALAHDSGIDRAYMSALERRVHTPTIELVFRLVIPLKVSVAEFMAEVERRVRNDNVRLDTAKNSRTTRSKD